MRRFLYHIISVVMLLIVAVQTHAQKMGRDEIDILRSGLEYFDKEAYAKGNSFLKSDSGYYIGWMYVGTYMYDRAADQEGYSKCLTYLLQSKKLLEKDFGSILRKRVNNFGAYMELEQRHHDYNVIANCLSNAFAILDKNDSAYWIADEYQKFNFQKDLAAYVGPYLNKSWIVFRNRNFTKERYKFLTWTYEDNLKLVVKLLDSAAFRIKENEVLNNQFLSPEINVVDYGHYYHQQSIIFAFLKRFPEAEIAFKKLEQTGYFASNNYALLKYAEGDFENAFKFFDQNNTAFSEEKTLEEWIYYEGILDVYRNQNKNSIINLNSWIAKVGSTPGFGWYNIALARSYMYHGDIHNARKALRKAKQFTEYHIGTTLGQDAYNLSINLIDLRLTEMEEAAAKFENRYWYVNIESVRNYFVAKWSAMFSKWLLLNSIANYGDRGTVLYEMFSAESISTWDEIWNLIRNFSLNFFEKKYEKLIAAKGVPPTIKDHFKYALAYLYEKDGDDDKAKDLCVSLLNSEFSASEYSSLLYFRVLELQRKMNVGDKKDKVNDMYNTYSQLLPFTEETMTFNLNVMGASKPVFDNCIARMKKCRIKITDENNARYPTANIALVSSNNLDYITLTVLANDGRTLIDQYKMSITDPEKDGVKLAYALFQIIDIKSP